MMQSSFVREKKKFSQDLKHSHHRVIRTSSSSRAVTQYSLRLLLARRKFGKSSSRCETTSKRFRVRAKIEEETFTCQRYVYIMYKTRKKNIGKANKKQPKVKNSLICAVKKTSTFHTKKKRTSDAIILSTTHTQRQQQQQQEREERRLYNNSRIIIIK